MIRLCAGHTVEWYTCGARPVAFWKNFAKKVGSTIPCCTYQDAIAHPFVEKLDGLSNPIGYRSIFVHWSEAVRVKKTFARKVLRTGFYRKFCVVFLVKGITQSCLCAFSRAKLMFHVFYWRNRKKSMRLNSWPAFLPLRRQLGQSRSRFLL